MKKNKIFYLIIFLAIFSFSSHLYLYVNSLSKWEKIEIKEKIYGKFGLRFYSTDLEIKKINETIDSLSNRINKIILERKFKREFDLKNNAFDFYSKNVILKKEIKKEFKKLNIEEKTGMVLVVDFSRYIKTEDLKEKIQKYNIGGIMTFNQDINSEKINKIKSYNKNDLPLLLMVDGEPSAMKVRFNKFSSENKDIDSTFNVKTKERSREFGRRISKMIYDMGYDINLAPVYDVGSNEKFSVRSFSPYYDKVKKLANVFMIETQENKVFATAKHFPGNGNTVGDSHKRLVYINGELKELENFKAAIDNGVVLMMVGHIAISNNEKWDTNGLPSTVSKKIMTELLKDELGFNGVVITDAMNMRGVSNIKDAEIKALEAGADIILMPVGLDKVYSDIVKKIKNDEEFARIIDEKVKKIIRLKIISKWNRGEF